MTKNFNFRSTQCFVNKNYNNIAVRTTKTTAIQNYVSTELTKMFARMLNLSECELIVSLQRMNDDYSVILSENAVFFVSGVVGSQVSTLLILTFGFKHHQAIKPNFSCPLVAVKISHFCFLNSSKNFLSSRGTACFDYDYELQKRFYLAIPHLKIHISIMEVLASNRFL